MLRLKKKTILAPSCQIHLVDLCTFSVKLSFLLFFFPGWSSSSPPPPSVCLKVYAKSLLLLLLLLLSAASLMKRIPIPADGGRGVTCLPLLSSTHKSSTILKKTGRGREKTKITITKEFAIIRGRFVSLFSLFFCPMTAARFPPLLIDLFARSGVTQSQEPTPTNNALLINFLLTGSYVSKTGFMS